MHLHRALPRELPVAAHGVFAASDEIIVAGAGEDWVVLDPKGDWVLARDRLLPPVPPAEGPRKTGSTDDGEKPTWCEMRFSPRADGGLRIVAKSGESDGFSCMHTRAEGTLIDGVRRNGRFTERARVSSTFALDDLFELSDGRVVATDREYALWTLEAGNFSKIAENWIWRIWKNLGPYGDGWIAQTEGGGLALVRNPPSRKRLFTPLALTIDGTYPEILEAVRTSTTSLLATSERGLFAYDIPTGIATLLEPKGLFGRPTWIGLDARGRIWLAGASVFLFVSPDRVEPVASILPFLGHVTVESVALNGSRLILALGQRGLLVLDTDQVAKLLLRPAPQSGSQAHQLRQVILHRFAGSAADAQ